MKTWTCTYLEKPLKPQKSSYFRGKSKDRTVRHPLTSPQSDSDRPGTMPTLQRAGEDAIEGPCIRPRACVSSDAE
jgi:hypothetical protein